jgi:hypothetical protein
MPGERVATDVVGDDLVATYIRGARRLEQQVAAGLRRGLDPSRVGAGEQVRGDATQAYRERQLRAARAILVDLEGRSRQVAGSIAAAAYRSTVFAIDDVVVPDLGAVRPRFGGVHQRAVAVLAGNLEASLTRAAQQARVSVETVFARATALEGPLPASGVAGVGFVGRRVDDPWRRLALEELGAGQVTLETRRQISANLVRRLQAEGATDALTGFVDRAGKRWGLDVYAEMVVRTTTREATSRATANRLLEHGLGAITVSSHPHREDVCTPYDGKTFALPGSEEARSGRFPVIDNLSPFHPRCRHVIAPAGVAFEDFEEALGLRAAQAAEPPAPAPERIVDELAEGATAGQPIGDALRVSRKARGRIGNALDAIDAVHTIPTALADQDIPVGARKLGRGQAGEYAYTAIGPNRITIGDASRSPAADFTHEVGHLIDHWGIGVQGRFESKHGADLAEWRQAIGNSAGVRRIRAALEDGTAPQRLADGTVEVRPIGRRLRQVLEYLVSPEELFARSYAQWIDTRSGGRIGLTRAATLAGFREQWDDEDFEEVAAALDRVFHRAGLLR